MSRTVLVALDGATYTVLNPLMENGVMPFLKEFVGGGTRGVLMSVDHPLTPPAFMTMVTGRSPGHHGIFDFVRGEDIDNQTYFTFDDSRSNRCETVWSLCNRQNRKSSAMNFVMTSPVEPVCGVVMPGMVHWKHLRRHAYPRTFYDKIKKQDWFDAKAMCWDFDHLGKAINANLPVDQAAWVQDHIDRELQWFEVLRFQMRHEPTDLVSIVFDGVDKLQHLCWPVLDPDLFPDNPEPREVELRELCHGYFRHLDGFLREIVELAGTDGRVFITSDHGFGPEFLRFRVNQFLHELGYLHWREDAGEIREDRKDLVLPLDWDRTLAYCVTRSSNGIHIRVAKKPGEAGVPANEYETFRQNLIDELRKLTVPDSGEPLVKKVMLREDIFSGPMMRKAPDLTVVLADHGLVWTSPGEKVVERKEEYSGMHYPEGVFLAHGPGIKKGEMIEPLQMVDVTPTLLYSLGLPVPSNLEGKAALEAFEAAHVQEHELEMGDPAGERVEETATPDDDDDHARGEDDNQLVYDQLRALGYVE